ncbi:hypothetical protein HYH02_012943 [Chlamydomonas schloesseri]|uniref:Transmembrane protein n=1 Tax=Chlamydomonas schloesseri TaxID=2026947 RepID=A0A835VYA1_9CHLO|nr:hypothetical protein HYH02_012943 [Chlamydomonas schloesseri]|eukprot:KAG2432370.1 hypothetical protein HYH02_012943 [Chlamydomonas schloesseri]
MLASNVQRGSAWPSLKLNSRGCGQLASSVSGATARVRPQVLTGALAPRSPVSGPSSSPAASVTAAATVSAAFTETASPGASASTAGAASHQSVAGKADTSTTSIWGSGPAQPRSARGSDTSGDSEAKSNGRGDSIQSMLLSALASSGPAPFGPMFTPPLVAGAAAGGLAVDGPGGSSRTASPAAWQPRRHLSSTTAAALPTLRVPTRTPPAPTSQSRSTLPPQPQQQAASGMHSDSKSQATAFGRTYGGATPALDIHLHGGWLGAARQLAAGLSALSFVSAVSVTVVCGAIKAAAAVSGPAVVYVATPSGAAASSAATVAHVTLHVFGAPPEYAVAAAAAGLLLGLVVSAMDAVWARRGGGSVSSNGGWAGAA